MAEDYWIATYDDDDEGPTGDSDGMSSGGDSDAPDHNDQAAYRRWQERCEERERRQRVTKSYCETCHRYRPKKDVYWSLEPYSNGMYSKCTRCAGHLGYCKSCVNYRTGVKWCSRLSLPSWKRCASYKRTSPAMIIPFCPEYMVSEKPHDSLRIILAFRRAYAAGRIMSALRSSAGFERSMKRAYGPGGKGQNRALAEVGEVVEQPLARP
jgi:hypothetical protein